MEQKTPARGHTFGLPRLGVAPFTSAASSRAGHPAYVYVAREIAHSIIAIIPEGFDRILPRGYSMAGAALLMARFEAAGIRGQALYARHTTWGEKESNMFIRDLKDGWLNELSAYMRWQLRDNPAANAVFQHALVHLQEETMRRLTVTHDS